MGYFTQRGAADVYLKTVFVSWSSGKASAFTERVGPDMGLTAVLTQVPTLQRKKVVLERSRPIS